MLLAALFFLGTFQIESAVVAPWVEAGRAPDAAEMKSLVGKKVTFEAARIRGPRAVACAHPSYEVVEAPRGQAFQGELEEVQSRGGAKSADGLAEALGFRSPTMRRLETGCGNELDYHFVDDDTVMFGLNDYVYRLKRKRPDGG
jgi:hypothetical protein